MSSSMFTVLPPSVPDPVFALQSAYVNDTFENKINLGIGAYRDENGKPWILPVVRKAKKMIVEDENANHEYLPIGGLKEFRDLAVKLIVGEKWVKEHPDCYASVQTISGTGALKVAADFVVKFFPQTEVYISDPSWGNHKGIFSNAGLKTKLYRYWDAKNLCLDLDGMIEDLENAPSSSLIILHPCAHNPTGVDPTPEQWDRIYQTILKKKHIPLFDSAYQGFASGDLDKDAYAVRMFAERAEVEFMICQSFAKNFGIYGERAGVFTIISYDTETLKNVRTHVELVIRTNYSNPPKFGALIVQTVLSDEKLYAEWKENLKTMSGRIKKMRQRLYDELKKLGTPGNWDHIINQIGMFSYTGLNEQQVKRLIEEFHIYLLSNGRISMAGVSDKNVEYLASSIHKVVTGN